MAIDKDMCRAGDVVKVVSLTVLETRSAGNHMEKRGKKFTVTAKDDWHKDLVPVVVQDGGPYLAIADLEFVKRPIVVGDVVRVVDNVGDADNFYNGEICTVLDVDWEEEDGHFLYAKEYGIGMYAYRFERVGNKEAAEYKAKKAAGLVQQRAEMLPDYPVQPALQEIAPSAAPSWESYRDFQVGDIVECITDTPSYSAAVKKGHAYTVVDVYGSGNIETTSEHQHAIQTTSISDWKLVGRPHKESPVTEANVSVSQMCSSIQEGLSEAIVAQYNFEAVLDMFSIKLISSTGMGLQVDKQNVARAEVVKAVNDALDMAGV